VLYSMGLSGFPGERTEVFSWGTISMRITGEDAEGFRSTFSSSPGIGAWQMEQATDALTILLGSVFGQDCARSIRANDGRYFPINDRLW
jgi:hypothetical protein